jgi:uncharacterized protein DUF6445
MTRQSVIVLDDFYEEPDEVRQLALSLTYRKKCGATYPGLEAIAPDRDWGSIRARLRSYIDDSCDAQCPKTPPFPQGKFRLALEADEETRIDLVHVDTQKWSGVIYLSKPADCREGIALYRHRATASVFMPMEWLKHHYPQWWQMPREQAQREWLKYFKNPENFEQIGLIPMAYNRAIILMAKVLHGTGAVFGTDKDSGRLSQHFEFYTD